MRRAITAFATAAALATAATLTYAGGASGTDPTPYQWLHALTAYSNRTPAAGSGIASYDLYCQLVTQQDITQRDTDTTTTTPVSFTTGELRAYGADEIYGSNLKALFSDRLTGGQPFNTGAADYQSLDIWSSGTSVYADIYLQTWNSYVYLSNLRVENGMLLAEGPGIGGGSVSPATFSISCGTHAVTIPG
jgi:hypothetical protein